MMLIMSSASPFIANYYSDDALIILVPIMLSELIFVGIGKLYDTVLQKNMQFKTIAIRNISASIISLIFAVVLAATGCGVYSLVLSTILSAAIINIWNFIAGQRAYKIQFIKIDFKESKDLIKVGAYQMGTQLLDYVSSKLDILLISSFLGVTSLGIYNLAKELVLKFVLIINTIVNKVMLPVLSYNSDNVSKLKEVFFSFVNKISIINIPIIGFVFLFSPMIVVLFYGRGYEEANDIVRILSVWSIFVVLNQPNGLIAIAMKRTDITFVYTIIRLLLMSTLLYFFARYSLISAALTMLFTYICMFIVSWAMLLNRTIHIRFLDYIRSFLKPSLAVLIIVSLIICINFLLPNDNFIVNFVLILIYWFAIALYVYIYERHTFEQLSSLINKKN